MQVNNNIHSPGFGMALKIKPQAVESLRKAPLDYIIKLEAAGKELKDFKVWDLEIYGVGRPRIVSSHAAYTFPAEVLLPQKNKLPLEIIWDGMTLGKSLKKGDRHILNIPLANKQEAQAAYDRIKNNFSWIEKAVEITKLLEKSEISDVDRRIQQRMDKAVFDLFSKYGTK